MTTDPRLLYGHAYDEEGTSDCGHGCGCWTGPYRSGGPDGVDPLGICPNHPDLTPDLKAKLLPGPDWADQLAEQIARRHHLDDGHTYRANSLKADIADALRAEREACALLMEARACTRHGHDKHGDAEIIRSR
jgi:hypothetical protein